MPTADSGAVSEAMSTKPIDPAVLTENVLPRSAPPRPPVQKRAASGTASTDGLDFVPPPPGIATTLAHLYVLRHRWQRPAGVVLGVVVVLLAGYLLIWSPLQNAQIAQSRLELSETLPNQIIAAYEAIYDETKVQQPAKDAATLRDQGLAAAKAGDRPGAETALNGLTGMLAALKQQYRITVSPGPDGKWGFWTFPSDNSDETNYYLVVQALNDDGQPLQLPVGDSATGKTETVSRWGVRVPEDVYRIIQADKNDNGTIDDPDLAFKEDGYVDPHYRRPVLGGTLTRW
jgi:hypothetical protein